MMNPKEKIKEGFLLGVGIMLSVTVVQILMLLIAVVASLLVGRPV